MSYKYIDPGFGFSGYSYNVDACFTPPLLRFDSYTYNPRFGVSFYTEDSYSNGYSSINFGSSQDTPTEFYLKFDEYFPETTGNNLVYQTDIRNGDSQILTIEQVATNIRIRALGDTELIVSTLAGDETYIEKGRANTIWLHVEADGQTGRITLAINGNYIFREQEGWGFNSVARNFSFQIPDKLPISNLIISDEKINLNETIVEIGCSAVETTMIAESDTYSSATAEDYVLQELDPSSLYDRLAPETKVTAMLAVAVPAYTTGDAVKYLKCRVVDGDNVTDYKILDTEGGQISLTEMTEEEFAELEGYAPLMAKQLPVASDTTFAKLSGLKVGWVTGS